MITHLSQLWADRWKIFLVLDEMVWPSLRVMALGLRLVPTWPAGLAKALALAIALAGRASNAGSGPAPDAASFSALPFAMVEGWGKWPNPEMAIGKHTMAGWHLLWKFEHSKHAWQLAFITTPSDFLTVGWLIMDS
jgi:hypothetical protein